MKRITIIALLLVISAASFSQQTNQLPALTKHDYLKKSKQQKTAARILFGVGASMSLVGIIIGIGEDLDQIGNPHKKSNTGAILFFTGLVPVAASIPLFIASSENKKKARNLSASFKMESRSVFQLNAIACTRYPAFSFKVSL